MTWRAKNSRVDPEIPRRKLGDFFIILDGAVWEEFLLLTKNKQTNIFCFLVKILYIDD